mgnify:FL=1
MKDVIIVSGGNIQRDLPSIFEEKQNRKSRSDRSRQRC